MSGANNMTGWRDRGLRDEKEDVRKGQGEERQLVRMRSGEEKICFSSEVGKEGVEWMALHLLGLLGGAHGGGIALLFLAHDNAVVLLVPLPVGGGIDLDDGVLHQGLGAHKLVVGGVVHDIQHASLARAALGTPGEGAGIKAQSALLDVATAATHLVHALAAELGHGGHAAELVLALLLVHIAATTGQTALVS